MRLPLPLVACLVLRYLYPVIITYAIMWHSKLIIWIIFRLMYVESVEYVSICFIFDLFIVFCYSCIYSVCCRPVDMYDESYKAHKIAYKAVSYTIMYI